MYICEICHFPTPLRHRVFMVDQQPIIYVIVCLDCYFFITMKRRTAPRRRLPNTPQY